MLFRTFLTWLGAVALAPVFLCGSGLTEELSLKQAIEIAQANNPNVSAARLSARAAAHTARGSRALTNPEITVSPTVVGDAGSDAAFFASQPLEINGSRRVRSRIATAQASASAFDSDALARDITLKVKQTYWNVVRGQKLLDLSRENVGYLESLDRAARRQVEVGTAPGSVQIKTEVELARGRQELAQAQLELDQSKSALNALLNRRDTDFTASDEPAFSEAVIDIPKLQAQALSQRPEIAAAQAQSDAARKQVEAARLRRVPDLALQARKETFGGQMGVAVAITVPLLDWGSAKAEKRSAQSAAESQEKLVEATRRSVELDVRSAALAVQNSSNIIRQYQAGILEKSEELARLAQKGYENGATSYLEVIEAQRTLRAVKADYVTALADHAKAAAQLDWATGAASVDITEEGK